MAWRHGKMHWALTATRISPEINAAKGAQVLKIDAVHIEAPCIIKSVLACEASHAQTSVTTTWHSEFSEFIIFNMNDEMCNDVQPGCTLICFTSLLTKHAVGRVRLRTPR